MKILHSSDWHLGKFLYGKSLLEDQEYFINKFFIPLVRDEAPDLVLISGDVYDRQIAPVDGIRLFDNLLSELSGLKVKTAFISGNHDGAERMAIMKALLRQSGIYISTCLQDAFMPVELEKDGEKVQLFLVPYLDNSVVRSYFQDESLRGESACMQRVIEELKPLFKPGFKKLLSAHCFAAGSLRSESESTIFVGGSGEIPPEVFVDFDYVALGHLHAPQKVGDNGRYSGSPLKYSVDEANHHKGVTMVEIEQGELTYRNIEVTPLRDIRKISGSFEELMARGKEDKTLDYVDITLTDDKPVLLAKQRLVEFYPNVLNVHNSFSAAGMAGGDRKKLKGKSEMVIFESFMKEINGTEPEEPVKALFSEVLEEVTKGGAK